MINYNDLTEEEFEFGFSHIIKVKYDNETGAIKYVTDIVTDWDGDYYIISEYGYVNDISKNDNNLVKEKYVFRSFDEIDDTGVERLFTIDNELCDTIYYHNGNIISDRKRVKYDPEVYHVSELAKDLLSMNIKDIRALASKKYNYRLHVSSNTGPNLHLPLDEPLSNVYVNPNKDNLGVTYNDRSKQLKKVHK